MIAECCNLIDKKTRNANIGGPLGLFKGIKWAVLPFKNA
jgi:hypothetical protein